MGYNTRQIFIVLETFDVIDKVQEEKISSFANVSGMKAIFFNISEERIKTIDLSNGESPEVIEDVRLIHLNDFKKGSNPLILVKSTLNGTHPSLLYKESDRLRIKAGTIRL